MHVLFPAPTIAIIVLNKVIIIVAATAHAHQGGRVCARRRCSYRRDYYGFCARSRKVCRRCGISLRVLLIDEVREHEILFPLWLLFSLILYNHDVCMPLTKNEVYLLSNRFELWAVTTAVSLVLCEIVFC